MGRTNIVLDDKLIAEALQITGLKTRREVVDYALKELILRNQQKELLKLRGKVKWEGNLNESRQGRTNDDTG